MASPAAAESKSTTLHNWMGNITYDASSVVIARSAADVQRVMRDRETYPSPVRAKGSHHSTTGCLDADGGTVVDMTAMNEIVGLDEAACLVTVQAGVLQIDLAEYLQARGFQQFINVEIGTMTMGSAATCGTKEASFYDVAENRLEYGQVSSYCVGMTVVLPDGSVQTYSEDGDDNDRAMLRMLRDSYGLLGILTEATFRIKPVTSVRFRHVAYTLDEFADAFDALLASRQSIMFFIYPFLNRIVVELRSQDTIVGPDPIKPSFAWRVRNFAWRVLRPTLANLLSYLPFRWLRNAITDVLGRLTILVQTKLVRGYTSRPPDQILRFRERAGLHNFTFTFWAFPTARYVQTLREYFAFAKEHLRTTGYRCDLVSLGYLVGKDNSGVFSYCKDSDVMTIDPGASGKGEWPEFLQKYNEFCIERDGRPMFNQTGFLTAGQAKQAYEKEIEEFLQVRKKMDPDDRLYNTFFKRMFSDESE